MATTLITVDCKLFQMMPYIIILKVGKFHQLTANRFSTARKKPVGGQCAPPGLNRVKRAQMLTQQASINVSKKMKTITTNKR